MRILAVTTRQWNPGDDFILYGIRNLFPKEAQWCVYDKNAHDRVGNHWITKDGLDNFDKIVFAGTPQWAGFSVGYLNRMIDNKDVYYIGIGHGEKSMPLCLDDLDLKVMRSAKLVTTRGPILRDELIKLNVDATLEVCPAYFASNLHRNRTTRTKPRIGCIYLGEHPFVKMPKMIHDAQVELYKEIDGEVVCHCLHEVSQAVEHFGEVTYTCDAKDYLDIYRRFDIVISSRFHGALGAMSTGAPAFLIGHWSPRCLDATSNFKMLKLCYIRDAVQRIEKLNYQAASVEVIRDKRRKFESYKKLIESRL